MADYQAPVNDIIYTLRHAAGLEHILATELFSHVDADTVEGVVTEVVGS